jgi:hypothetical protein
MPQLVHSHVGIFIHVSSNHKHHTAIFTQQIKDPRHSNYDIIHGPHHWTQHKRFNDYKQVSSLPASFLPIRHRDSERRRNITLGIIRHQIGNTYEHIELADPTKTTTKSSMEDVGHATARNIWRWE